MPTEKTDKTLEIIHYPHPALRHKSKPIRRVDAELHQIVRQMFSRMYDARGIGLAANQVHLPLRLFVVNLTAEPDEGEEHVFINPVITLPRGSEEMEEGCLSLPELYGQVRRPKQIRLLAYNLRGQEVRLDLEGMLARVVQHETDHLDGVLFPDRMDVAAREELDYELRDLERTFQQRRQQGEIPDNAGIARELSDWEARYC